MMVGLVLLIIPKDLHIFDIHLPNRPDMVAEKKRELGQFFTRDSIWLRPHIKSHILSLSKKYKSAFDPFAGDGHLLKVSESFGFDSLGCDIDSFISQRNDWQKNDSITNVIKHKDTFVLTNPPYLAKNSARKMKSEMIKYFERGYVKGIVDSEFSILDDLFKIAIAKTINAYKDSIWIVPESGIQDIEKLPLWKKYLHSVTILEENPFTDTEHPVCVMIFSQDNPKQEIWKNNKKLGKWSELMNTHRMFKKGSAKLVKMKFNDPNGNLGFRAVDGTKEDGSMRIRFCLGDDLNYPRESIKISSRHLTYISVNLKESELLETIKIANSIIDKYRKSTHDVFLTAFMGNTKERERRRRLDYKLARVIFNRAYSELLSSQTSKLFK